MKTASIYGAFNARWLSPEDVARAYVPTAHLSTLVKLQNSLLMGPRGCGKTTLLKMLTRRALSVWKVERIPKEPELTNYPLPDFEAIYIPSDIRWSYELSALDKDIPQNAVLAERIQRCEVALSGLLECTRVFEDMLQGNSDAEQRVLESLIGHFALRGTVPSFADVRIAIQAMGNSLRHGVVRRDPVFLASFLDSVPHAFAGHALDLLDLACSIFDEYCGHDLKPNKWAFCFDELEIAPSWLQSELLTALRSISQRFLLKLTWSPVLPRDRGQHQETLHDFGTIKLWHSHAGEAKPFCRAFSTRLIRDITNDSSLSPKQIFGTSLFAQDPDDEGNDVYAQGSVIWSTMVDLAKWDDSFRSYLKEHEIDPENPISDDVRQRDVSLRKIKPIVLIREAYRDPKRQRSRKNPGLFWGEDAIYAMSEGNPRLLAGLLNDLLDAGLPLIHRDVSQTIPSHVQARVLMSASNRVRTAIRTYPVQARDGLAMPLATLVERLGEFLHFELVQMSFQADPIGSFIVDDEVSPTLAEEIKLGLLIGAFVPVTPNDVPSSVVGSRIRLSYILSPYYRLPFRNYRSIRLTMALRIATSKERTLYGTRRLFP